MGQYLFQLENLILNLFRIIWYDSVVLISVRRANTLIIIPTSKLIPFWIQNTFGNLIYNPLTSFVRGFKCEVYFYYFFWYRKSSINLLDAREKYIQSFLVFAASAPSDSAHATPWIFYATYLAPYTLPCPTHSYLHNHLPWRKNFLLCTFSF